VYKATTSGTVTVLHTFARRRRRKPGGSADAGRRHRDLRYGHHRRSGRAGRGVSAGAQYTL